MERSIPREVSYIRARDASIQFFTRDRLKNARKNIATLLSDCASLDDIEIDQHEDEPESLEEEDEGIQVYLRVKPGESKSKHYTIEGNQLTCKMPEKPSTSRTVKEKNVTCKSFYFTKIFGPDSKQEEIFNYIVKPRVLEFMNGKNSSLFTYGASGAGKTFTIIGTAEEPGLIPRALEYLFRTLPKLPQMVSVKPTPDGRVLRLNTTQQDEETEVRRTILKTLKTNERVQHIHTYNAMRLRLSNDAPALLEPVDQVSLGVWVSFAEIYNEEIYDLLQPLPPKDKPRSRLRIATVDNNIYIKNLTYVNVSNGIEAYQVFQCGLRKLNYAKTSVNNHSSRSHSIFSIRIAQALKVEGVHVSTFNFCDLAGVERSKKTMNVGDRLKESNSINRSLMVLGRCIAALRHTQKCPRSNQLIPFRDSKLTQLFQNALSGLEDLCMIVNINTSAAVLDESHVLNFSAMAKDISIQSVQSQEELKDSTSDQLEYPKNLDEEIVRLGGVLAEARKREEYILQQRKDLLKIEEQHVVESFKGILEDNKKLQNLRLDQLHSKYERNFQANIRTMEIRYKKKFDRSKKRKLDQQISKEKDVRHLQTISETQLTTITELDQTHFQLQSEKDELLKKLNNFSEELLLDQIENNKKIIFELKKKHSVKEIDDSYLRNEAECADGNMS